MRHIGVPRYEDLYRPRRFHAVDHAILAVVLTFLLFLAIFAATVRPPTDPNDAAPIMLGP